ncbi:3-hydroxyacyl-CoA dehydrogenase/enoyl-CoA hydratase family protein [Weeksella virosa]|uniref:3-hydroxyacyl-CoA dehydrogenase NAD-binding protein n=1 Tax=Weeksella virosa (strain ATCC 43766 / DSM 16922 / JCM 21250 / CCUG 30538 / CDC 9751 / IAM 14551 / NBRC 16016 / NCTC 11634 / CL345/78) TaxID=865938 RepID=F0NYJ9_WEEVC|nr:3-hydroxyacyl-CoA dehydrogenase/enoyl-CoA hydratase family protein [Weeksella virosa]ADX67119.1 3-hydroxyacyl-CoA dehydrogenase NAD-binding protein [Weeksella virosa DSM 16922]MDK7676252.1 3-hydroxyacyl-CoA dehydrogenase/enoyl-CoA hydratase family protein [Weeksella virosa]SUP53390.1 Probable 3-hydroxyacyl-CoA dehydrogenase [Weeksella virosa]VEH63144.1 Probable 3-hydroxyacyl-CoA dehydrogenase [Weeksella virosa]
MRRHIKHVTVLGSGVMGSGIACHLANIGLEVLMLDMVPRELTPQEQAKGLTLESKIVRNRTAQSHLDAALKSNPSPIYDKAFASRITVGNFDDDLDKIKNSDWVIEVIIERLDIKKSMFEKVDALRTPGTFITTNTSGIPIHLMAEGRTEDFQKHFCGTHFFNPPRYLKLFEIIPGPKTDHKVVEFFQNYASLYLGKTPVLCKDTPGFIGNRVGVYSMAKIMELTQEIGLTIEEVDTLTGSILGRPKTGTFKLGDLVGLDTAYNVTKGLQQNATQDQMIQELKESKFLDFLINNKFLGDKTGKGFYYKEKAEDGSWNRFALDLDSLTYRPMVRAKVAAVEAAKQAGSTKNKLTVLLKDSGKAGELIRKHFASLFAYVSQRVPEITDVFYPIDDAIRTGYAWKIGPFETWDLVGLQKGIELVEAEGYQVADWVKELAKTGADSFYKIENGKKLFYNQNTKTFDPIPGQDAFIILDNIRKTNEIWSNKECSIQDLGDGIINIEFRSKMNSLGGGVLQGINKGIDLAEKEYRGVVIGNQADNFSVGANLAMIMMMAAEQDWWELNMAIKMFQDTMMRVRYSSIPVISAPHGMALGGGCEVSIHADKMVAAAETYIGLVEVGVGLIPGGGGSKEFTRRAMMNLLKDDVKVNHLRDYFMNIATAKVATSAYEAKNMGIVRDQDVIVVNTDRQIAEAKKQAILLAEAGYTQPVREKIRVLGREAMGMFYVGTDSMVAGNFATDHDRLIANKLGYVMTGGNLSESTEVSEQYLLDLEREAFLSLCGERKTLERIQHMLKTGKPLRN